LLLLVAAEERGGKSENTGCGAEKVSCCNQLIM